MSYSQLSAFLAIEFRTKTSPAFTSSRKVTNSQAIHIIAAFGWEFEWSTCLLMWSVLHRWTTRLRKATLAALSNTWTVVLSPLNKFNIETQRVEKSIVSFQSGKTILKSLLITFKASSKLEAQPWCRITSYLHHIQQQHYDTTIKIPHVEPTRIILELSYIISICYTMHKIYLHRARLLISLGHQGIQRHDSVRFGP